MESNYRYVEPYGTSAKNSDLAQILKHIRERGEDYWHNHSYGWAALKFRKGDVKTDLVFTKKDGAGFHASFAKYPSPESPGIFQYYSWDGSDDETEVILNLGGDDTVFPRFMFVSEEQMAAIVEDFFDGGKRSDRVKWLEPKDVDPKWVH